MATKACNHLHLATLRSGITSMPEFERKGLAAFAANLGFSYEFICFSTIAALRMHAVSKGLAKRCVAPGHTVIDPDAPDRIAKDARRMRDRGVIQVGAFIDPWSSDAAQFRLGSRCLRAILSKPGWIARVLTRSTHIFADWPYIVRHGDRVLVGVSLPGTPESAEIISAIEPHAASIEHRMGIIRELRKWGLRSYGMLWPLLPGISDQPKEVSSLVSFVARCGAEEIFVEPVNARSPGLRLAQEALVAHGYTAEAAAIAAICSQAGWSRYVVSLLRNVQAAMREHSDIRRLRFLLYPSRLLPEDAAAVRADDAGVVWLGKEDKTAVADGQDAAPLAGD